MARKKVTKTERLLREIQKAGKKGMSHKDIVRFLLRGTGNRYGAATRRLFDSRLYGTNARTGILQLCGRDWTTGNYTVPKGVTIEGPFTSSRDSRGYFPENSAF